MAYTGNCDPADPFDSSTPLSVLDQLIQWEELVEKEEADEFLSPLERLKTELRHSIQHPGNKKGNFSERAVLRRRLHWERWSKQISNFEFRRYYRMSRECFLKLVELLRDDLEGDEKQGRCGSPNGCMTPELKLSMTLRWMAGGSYLDIYFFHGVSDGAFWRAKKQTIDAILNHQSLDLCFPDLNDTNALQKISDGFKEKSEMGIMDHCIGAIDGCLIDLHSVRGECAKQALRYYTRKGSFALNLQAVCDSSRKFLWIGINNPGSVHDSIAFMHGSLWRALESAECIGDGFYLVGDAAYKGFRHLLVPFDGQDLPKWHDSFNFHLSQIRIQIECAFGMLYNRWGIFWRGLRMTPENATKVIEAAIRVHNFVIDNDADPEPEAELQDQPDTWNTDAVVNDRLHDDERPLQNENNAPAHHLWYSDDNQIDVVSSIAMRSAMVQRLEYLKIPRPEVDRFGKRRKITAKVLGRQ